MPVQIEIWRSVNGTGDNDFTLLVTLPDGASFEYVNTPVVPGRTYLYKARRIDTGTGATSPWSGIVVVTAQYPKTGVNTMPPLTQVNVGANTRLGLGIEGTFAQPVRAARRAEYASSDITVDAPPIFADSLFNSPAEFRKAVVGVIQVGGDMSLNITPEGAFTRILCGLLGAPTTTAIAGPPARSSHVWKNTFSFLPLSIVEQKGPYFFVTTGCRVGRFTVTARKTQDRPLFVTANVMGVHQLRYDAEAQVGLDTATIDTLEHWSAVNARMSLDGSPWVEVQDIDITIDKQLERIDNLDGYRGMSHYSRGSTVRLETTLYFSTDGEYKRFLGQPQATVAPYGAGNAIQPAQAVLNVVSPNNAAGYPNELNITLFRGVFTALGNPVAGRDAIMQRVTITPQFDSTAGTDVQIEVINGETNANIIAAGTAITPVPANAATSFTA